MFSILIFEKSTSKPSLNELEMSILFIEPLTSIKFTESSQLELVEFISTSLKLTLINLIIITYQLISTA